MSKKILILFSFMLLLSLSFITADGEPYIDPEILEAFETQDEVRVIVKVRDTTGIHVTKEHTEEEKKDLINQKKVFLDDVTDTVLSTLSANEFKLEDRFISGRGFYGRVTKSGFEKLVENSNIAKIYLDKVSYIQPVEIVDYLEEKNILKESENDSVHEFLTLEEEQKPGVVEEAELKSWFSKLIQFFKSLFKLE